MSCSAGVGHDGAESSLRIAETSVVVILIACIGSSLIVIRPHIVCDLVTKGEVSGSAFTGGDAEHQVHARTQVSQTTVLRVVHHERNHIGAVLNSLVVDIVKNSVVSSTKLFQGICIIVFDKGWMAVGMSQVQTEVDSRVLVRLVRFLDGQVDESHHVVMRSLVHFATGWFSNLLALSLFGPDDHDINDGTIFGHASLRRLTVFFMVIVIDFFVDIIHSSKTLLLQYSSSSFCFRFQFFAEIF